MSKSERIMAQADELLRRVSPAARDLAKRQRRRRQQELVKRVRRAVIAAVVAFLAMALAGGILSLFSDGWLLMMILVTAVLAFGFLVFPGSGEPTSERLAEAELPALPARTEQWLASQRLALPPPAARQLDTIATRLEELRPQLANLDPREPAAVEVRRLVGVELPELVEGYKRVPDHLRKDSGDGRSPEKQLMEGLDIVENEIQRMTRQLAAGELDALATQGKFLELKYRGDSELSDS
ncbi:MAG: hypothetical protein ABR601_01185 [Parasphingopyxis sp.]|nr:hypothetical protein [Sphingomonadales bacterium]